MGETSFLRKAVILTIFFVCGAFSSVLGNVMYTTKVNGLHHYPVAFARPWFQNWAMFLGMSVLIFTTPIIRLCRCPEFHMGGKLRGWGLFRQVSIPGLCDFSASILQNVALLYLIPSIWQMLRGIILFFTALLAIFYRHRRLRAIDWLGVCTTIVGIALVGLSAILRGSGQDSSSSIANASIDKKILAIVLLILAQGLQAFQTIVEEELLHDVDASEEEVVAFEGMWGLFFTTFLAMPLANILPSSAGEGLYENSIESFSMFFHSWTLVGLVLGFCVVILGLNLSGMMVTMFASAVHRNIYEALRSIAVWILSLIIHWIWPHSDAGETLDMWSILQAGGFLVSIFGSFIYNRIIKIPGFDYADDSKVESLDLVSTPAKDYEELR